jgi:hypothetical protein
MTDKMVKRRMVAVIREQVDPTAALQDVSGMADDVPVFIEGSVLYPYIQYTAKCTVPTLLGRKSLSVDCLVDGINGLGATADTFSVEQVNSNDEKCLHAEITSGEAQQAAQRTVTHSLGKQLKVIAPFDVQLEPAGTIYKRFWIIRIGDDRVIADSVTGGMHPLHAFAA